MDAHLFRRFCDDVLPALIGCRIEKIYRTAEGTVTFSLYGLGKIWQRSGLPSYDFSAQKYYLTYKEGRDAFLFLSHGRVSASGEPPAFIMRLRKYLAGRHIKSAYADWIRRKIILEVQDVWLSLDLRGGLDLHFACPEGAIFSPKNAENQSAGILPENRADTEGTGLNAAFGESLQDCETENTAERVYLDFEDSYRMEPALSDKDFSSYWPDFSELSSLSPNSAQNSADVWKKYPVLTPLLRKTLPYLCAEEQASLYADLQFGGGDVFVYTQNGRVLKINQSVENNPLAFAQGNDKFFVSAWKIPQELLRSMGYDRNTRELVFENAVDALLFVGDMVLAKLQKQNAGQNIRQLQSQLKRLTRLSLKLEEEETRLTRLFSMKEDALLLQANLYSFKPEERHGEARVFDYEGKERVIQLDKAKTVRENMENYFHAADRGKRGLEHLERRRQELEFEKQNLLNRMWEEDAGAGIKEPKQKPVKKQETDYGLLGKMKNVNNKAKFARQEPAKKENAKILSKYPKEVQIFRSSDGFMILRGRDTKGNGLALKMASSYDVWVHIAEGTSAHVIIKRDHAKQEIPPQTMQEAGALALLKSRAKTEDSGLVQFSYAKYIRPMKNAGQGMVHVDKSEGTYQVKIRPEYEEILKI